MSIVNANNKMNATGNGSTTVFPYTFKVNSASEMVVTRSRAGVETVLVLTTDYTVSGVGAAAGGNVTFVVAPLTGDLLAMRRVVPYTQLTDIKNQSAYFPEVLENALDVIVMQAQQLAEESTRTVRVPVTSTTPPEEYLSIVEASAAAAAASEAAAQAAVVGNIGAAIGGATSKAVPVDADEVAIRNSVGGALNRLTWANLKATILAALSAAGGSSLVGHLPAGTGAVSTNLSAHLALKVRGLKRNYGAALDGVTDDTAKLVNAINDGKIIEVEEGTCLVTSAIPNLATGQKIYGWDRYHSKIKFSGAVNGFVMNAHNSIENLRLIGNATMTTANFLVDIGKNGAAYRSAIKRCIIGGQSTSIGDVSNIRSGGVGAQGGASTFLMVFEDTYFFNSSYGLKNSYTGTQVNNALSFKGCEFHSNLIGAVMIGLNAVKFTQTTFEGNDEEGLILGNSNSCTLDTCYFESNNQANTSTIKSDLYIGRNATLTGGATPLGTALSIENSYFAAGTNTLFGIYQDGQRNVKYDNLFFANYGANTSINVVSSGNNTGSIDMVFVSSAAPIVIGALATDFQLGHYTWTGVNHFADRYSYKGITGSIANTATFDIGGLNAGETYLVSVADSANTAAISGTFIAQHTVSGTLVLTTLQAVGCSVGNFFGSVRVTNSSGGAITFNWAVTKIK